MMLILKYNIPMEMEEPEDQRTQRLEYRDICLHGVLHSPLLIPTFGLVRLTLFLDDEVIT